MEILIGFENSNFFLFEKKSLTFEKVELDRMKEIGPTFDHEASIEQISFLKTWNLFEMVAGQSIDLSTCRLFNLSTIQLVDLSTGRLSRDMFSLVDLGFWA